jgi:starch-binding outer membrane protein, SusD/RagB family
MRRFKFLFILFILFLSTLSCKKDFLDVPDESILTRQDFVTDLKTTALFLNGIYVKLAWDFYQGPNQIYPDIIADDIKPVTATSKGLAAHYNWSQIAGVSGSQMDLIWQHGYQIARSTSFVLEKADEYRNQDPIEADNIKAQAYALRSFVHFVMVNVFAQSYNFTSDASHSGIPYVISSDWTKSVARNTVADVYANMIDDLNSAIPLFNSGPVNVLLLNRNAAKALLARVLLYKEDYVSAKNIAREVVTNVPMMTGANYPSKLFTPQETEALFQLAPSGASTNGGYSTSFSGRFFFSGKSTVFIATKDIINILKEDPMDVRNSWIKSGAKDTITKYPVDVIPGFTPTSSAYYPTLIRSSEMYLTAAESYAKLHIEDSARIYLDAIRMRANPSAAVSSATGSALIDSIHKERRKELAFEGFRMFDLLRWKKGVDRIDAYSSNAKNLPYPSNKAIAPIPVQDAGIAGIPQNPDY